MQVGHAGDLRAAQGHVFVVCPGGLEHGGGIGRQMGYFLNALSAAPTPPQYSVLDSRGPWFLGASRGKSILSLVYLAVCFARLAAARCSKRTLVAHINITGRGSTLRKMFLVTAAQMIGVSYVLHVHDYDYMADYTVRGNRQQSLVRRMFQRAARVIVLGAADKSRLQGVLGLSPSNVVVMHNAVPDPHPAAAHGGMPIRLLFLGYLSERKGVSDLLQALADESLKGLDWRATIAGGGDVDLYAAKARSLGIAARIDFPGWLDRSAVEAAFARSDVLLLPSYAEGLAMAVLEGLSWGVAVITTPVGAHAEVIEDGRSGLLLPPGNVPALAEAIARVITDPDLRLDLQRGARRRFLDEFEINAYTIRLCALHARLLAESQK